MRMERPAKSSVACALNHFNENHSPTFSEMNSIPPTQYSQCQHHQHPYNCEQTPQLHWFYHATFFSSAKKTFLATIKQGYLQGCPVLTYQSTKQHIAHNERAIIKDHMNQARQGTQSTKCTIENMHPVPDYTYFTTTDTTAIIYTDQTGKFLIQLSHRYKYVMIFSAYSCNAILSHLIKNRSSNELLQVYQHFYTILHNAGLSPHMHKMNNKVSADIKRFTATQNEAV